MKSQIKYQKIKINGWINLDKPYSMSSAHAITQVKKIFNPNKIGHAGTLDPLATGVLPLAIGRATKTICHLQDAIKKYSFKIKFGQQTSTDDAEGEIVAVSDVRPTFAEIEDILPYFIGEITQIPPIFSAIKINGKRAYSLARAGEKPEIPSRIVTIKSLKLKDLYGDEALLEVVCGKGTYIRSLARDIAKKIGTIGYVSYLRRNMVGFFDENNIISLDDLKKYVYSNENSAILDGWLFPIEAPLGDILAASKT